MLLCISSKYYDCCKRFNETADRLSKLDEGCPKFRYDLAFTTLRGGFKPALTQNEQRKIRQPPL